MTAIAAAPPAAEEYPLAGRPPVRVLFVDSSPTEGGAPSSLALLLANLHGVEPMVVHCLPEPLDARFTQWKRLRVPLWDTRVPGAVEPPGGRGRPRNTLDLLWSYVRPEAKRLVVVAREHGAQLIHHNNDITAGLPALAAAWRLNIPCIVHHRGFEAESRLARLCARHTTHHVCVSDSVADHLRAWGAPAHLITTIHNGIEVGDPVPPRPAGDTVTIGVVGRFMPWKGMHVVVDAALRLVQDYRQVRFIFVGGPDPSEPDYYADLQARVLASPHADRIAMLGERTNAKALMVDMDIFVHAAVEPEPCARVLLEAMAAGCAVISTAHGGSPELLADGAGQLLPPGDVDALVAAVARLIEDVPARRALQERGQAQVRERFTAARVARQVEALYAAVLDRG